MQKLSQKDSATCFLSYVAGSEQRYQKETISRYEEGGRGKWKGPTNGNNRGEYNQRLLCVYMEMVRSGMLIKMEGEKKETPNNSQCFQIRSTQHTVFLGARPRGLLCTYSLLVCPG